LGFNRLKHSNKIAFIPFRISILKQRAFAKGIIKEKIYSLLFGPERNQSKRL
jgi:hypothetical protein